ncbi:MAG: MFS transporter [Actinobacteria bacterium]|nr:MFS transporter [Actinomycetota bacterium]
MSASAQQQPPSWVARMHVDVTPLRASRDFRLLFFSGVITYLGSMITYVALPFQVAAITGSFVAVGLIGLAELVPLVVFGLWGGALADSLDRRIMVVATEVAAGVLVMMLLLNSLLSSPQLWVLYVVAMLLAAVDGLQRPSLDAMTPRVVAHDQLAAAAALNAIKWQFGSIIGPAVGGLLLSAGGAVAAYGFDVVTFVLSIVLLWRVRSIKATGAGTQRASLRHVVDGVHYAMSRKDLLGTYAVDMIAMAFAFPYALFPFLAEDLGAPWALGLLYSAGAVGSLIVTLTSGWTSTVHRHGRAIVVAAAMWGLGISLVGATTSLPLVLLFLAIAGGADMVSGIFRAVMWNQTIPDDVRGRMAGIELLSYSIGPLLGQVRSSTAASLTSLRASLVSGGVLCVVGVAIAAIALPSLWNYDDRYSEDAIRERDARRDES